MNNFDVIGNLILNLKAYSTELILDIELELAINACYAISLLIVAEACRVVTLCTQAELTHNW